MILKVYNAKANPPAVLRACAEALRRGELIIIPTDTQYSVCCDALNQKSLERLAQLKGVDPSKSRFSILCSTMSQVSNYAKMDDSAFKLIKNYTPGPFTFLLPTGSALPKIYKGRKEVGVRIPRHHFVQELIELFGQPITGFSVPMPQGQRDEAYLYNPELIDEAWGLQVAFVADGGEGTLQESAIIDCTTEPYTLLREGPEKIELEQ